MLALLGYLMVFTFLILILSKRISPFIGLTLVPVLFGLIGGFGSELGAWMIEGIQNVAPTAILIMFAILYFGIMLDAGLFDPVTSKIIQIVKGDPLKVIVGTAVLAGIVGFDGDGSSTFLIVVSAFLPLYKRMGIPPVILACIVIMQVGITTLVPWGGPIGRVASVLNLDPTALYLQMLPGMIVGLFYVVGAAYIIGLKERARLNIGEKTIRNAKIKDAAIDHTTIGNITDSELKLKRPKLVWINFLLSAVIMVAIVLGWLPPAALFILGTALALLINYPVLKEQRKRVAAHAPNALAVASMILAAGIFAGIFNGTLMSEAMAETIVTIIPTGLGQFTALITAIVSVPGLFLLGPDGFYFGILPVLAETAASFGVDPLAVGVASLYGTPFGIMGPLVASVYLLIQLTGIELGDLHRYTAKWAAGLVLIYIIVGVFLGTISLF